MYWAEGSKEKDYGRASRIVFSNSDPYMIKTFLEWLLIVIKIPKDKIYFDIMLHESNKERIKDVISHWSKYTNFPKKEFQHIYFKKNKINTKRKNIGENYFGLLRIIVRESSSLNRKTQGWVEGINKDI